MYTANLNYPSLQSLLQDAVSAPAFSSEAWALPCWNSLPYRSVQVVLPDGSTFWLCAPDLAAKAARAIRLPGAAAMTHLVEQVVPMVEACPEFLLELAAKLTWTEARSMARGAFWKSPSLMLERQFRTLAAMSLNPKLMH